MFGSIINDRWVSKAHYLRKVMPRLPMTAGGLGYKKRDPLEQLRIDLSLAYKEYRGIDLIVELTQNGLDAMDQKRFDLVINKASEINGTQISLKESVSKWNSSVDELVEKDYQMWEVLRKNKKWNEMSILYNSWNDTEARKKEWWKVLATKLTGSENHADDLQKAAESYRPVMEIGVNVKGGDVEISILDNGVGMENPFECFMMDESEKRETRRRGVRGAHGWGLSSILTVSRKLLVIGKKSGKDAKAYEFRDYSRFRLEDVPQPHDEELDLSDPTDRALFSRKFQDHDFSGTQIIISATKLDDGNVLGHSLNNPSELTIEKFSNLLRMYTPIGQVNDFVLHPAFHNLRKDDIEINLTVSKDSGSESAKVDFDLFRISEHWGTDFNQYEYHQKSSPPNATVHVVDRVKKGGHVYLNAAEIQSSKDCLAQVKMDLFNKDALPLKLDDSDKVDDSAGSQISQGFQFAFSGGMWSQILALSPKGLTGNYRGVVLTETAKPSLGRKNVVDQRTHIAKAARSTESLYSELRAKTLPKGLVRAGGKSMTLASWRIRTFGEILKNLEMHQPPSSSLSIWADRGSKEAKVMLTFAEMLNQKVFGEMKIIRCSLGDQNDFRFHYQCELTAQSIPNQKTADLLDAAGTCMIENISGSKKRMHYLGVGEFKFDGEDLIKDFDPTGKNNVKNANAIDLFVCWEFDENILKSSYAWNSEEVYGTDRMLFPGQTHEWSSDKGAKAERDGAMAVVELKTLIEELVANGQFEGAPAPWPDVLPSKDKYYNL